MKHIQAEITGIKWSSLELKINGADINMHLSSGAGWNGYTPHLLTVDRFYLYYRNGSDVMALLRAINENNRAIVVLSKLVSIMWQRYSMPALSGIIQGRLDAVGALRSVYLSLTHKEPRESSSCYLKIKELLPEAWTLFKDEGSRRYLEKLMEFETELIARAIQW